MRDQTAVFRIPFLLCVGLCVFVVGFFSGSASPTKASPPGRCPRCLIVPREGYPRPSNGRPGRGPDAGDPATLPLERVGHLTLETYRHACANGPFSPR